MNIARSDNVLIDRRRPQPAEPLEDDSGINLMEYWRIFRRHWISVIALGIAGYLGALWYANSLTPMYSASVTLVVDPSRGSTGISDPYINYYSQKLFYDTQQTVLMSREIAERTAEKLSAVERERLVTPPEPRGIEKLTSDIGGAMRTLFSQVGQPQASAPTPVPAPDMPNAAARPLTRYGAAIQGGRSVSPGRETQIMTISFRSHDRALTAAVANTMAEAYIEYTNESQESLSEQSVRWMAQQVERLKEKLTESQNALQEFQVSEGLINLEDMRSLTSARLQAMSAQVAEAQRRYDELAERYGPKHPRLIQAQTDLETARRQLSSESQSVVLDADKRFQLSKLENDVRGNQEIYDLFLNRFRQMDVTTSERVSPIYKLDEAQVPGAPYSPNTQRISSVGMFAGLFLGLLLAWVREKLDNSFHTPAQLEADLGIPVIGAVPLISRDESRMGRRMAKKNRRKGPFSVERYYLHHSKSPFAESINHVRTGIIYSRPEQAPKTILISSSVQPEGKTTLAANLAFALSQLGETVLIDADLRKPRVHEVAATDTHEGLVDVLVGRVELREVLVPDEGNSTLKVLKSGVIPPNPQEMLASKRFEDVLGQLEEKFEYVVIDCAPVLPVSDALILSSKVDAFLMVVKADSTAKDVAREAIKRVKSVQAPLVGLVLSQFSPRRSEHYGRYSYYSKYYSYSYGK